MKHHRSRGSSRLSGLTLEEVDQASSPALTRSRDPRIAAIRLAINPAATTRERDEGLRALENVAGQIGRPIRVHVPERLEQPV